MRREIYMADVPITPVQDPSQNVLILIEKTIDHFEKMQEMAQKFNDDRLAIVVKKLDDDRIGAVEASRRERAEESKRIDARWLSDTNNVVVANDRAIKQAELLNSQMLDNAEVLRKSVESTATTIATQLEKMTTQQNERIAALERVNSENVGRSSGPSSVTTRIDELERFIAQQLQSVTEKLGARIDALEKVQYEDQGKSSAPSAFMTRIDELERLQSENQGSSKGKNQMWILITSGVLFLLSVLSFLIPLLTHE